MLHKVMTYVHDIGHHLSNMLCIALRLRPKLCRLHAFTSRLTKLISLAMGRSQQEADHLFLARIVHLGCALLPHNHKLCQDTLSWQGIDKACGCEGAEHTSGAFTLSGKRWFSLLLSSDGKAHQSGQPAVILITFYKACSQI